MLLDYCKRYYIRNYGNHSSENKENRTKWQNYPAGWSYEDLRGEKGDIAEQHQTHKDRTDKMFFNIYQPGTGDDDV